MHETVIVRQARLDEVGVIHQVLATAFRGLLGRGYGERALQAAIVSPQQIGQRVAQGSHVLVAEVAGQITGTATGLEEHEALHVCSLAVDPAWQGRGIAR